MTFPIIENHVVTLKLEEDEGTEGIYTGYFKHGKKPQEESTDSGLTKEAALEALLELMNANHLLKMNRIFGRIHPESNHTFTGQVIFTPEANPIARATFGNLLDEPPTIKRTKNETERADALNYLLKELGILLTNYLQ